MKKNNLGSLASSFQDGSAYELRRRNVRGLKKRLMRKGREEEDIERKKKNCEFQI